jgi:GDP-4-dehydro-6-deoxy-D-mannose reductase
VFRVLVTGACGFVGRHLCRALHRDLPPGSQIVPAVRAGKTHAFADAVALDVTDERAPAEILRSVRPTHVVHLAAISSVREASADLRRAWDVNVTGTLNLAQAISNELSECRLVYIGSADIYGESFRRGWPLDETAGIEPASGYGASKAAADILIGQMARQGLKAVRFRPLNHTGPGQSDAFVLPSVASQIARIELGKQEPVLKVGNVTVRRDFLDVRDVVDAYVRAVVRFDALPNGCVMNLASGAPVAIHDVLKDLVAMSTKPIQIVTDPDRVRSNEIGTIVASARKARELLGWEPQSIWSDTLTSILDHWRERTRAEARKSSAFGAGVPQC